MAIYHLSVKTIGRGSGRSAVGAAAYRSGERLRNEQDGVMHDYTKRRGATGAAAYRSGEEVGGHDFTARRDIIYSEIMLPDHAPREYADRSTLWNAVEKSERNGNARLSREVVVALPNELDPEQQKKLVQDYVQRNFVDDGMCADFSIHAGHIHDKKDEVYPFQDLAVRKENPHAHIMLTVRPINKDGTWGAKSGKEYILDRNGERIKLPSGNYKSRKIELTNWDKSETLVKWREDWARTVNREFDRLGIDERIDHRTLKAQGIERDPTKHMGHELWNQEKKGIKTKLGNENRDIYRENAKRLPERMHEKMHELRETHFSLHTGTSEIKAQISQLRRESFAWKATAEDINERAEHIRDTSERLRELTNERHEMGFFVKKKEIDNQIKHLEQTQKSANDYFKREYGIAPDESAQEITRLERKAAENQRICGQLEKRLDPLRAQQETTLLEYQRQKLLADISYDREKIYTRLDELEKQSRPPKQSARYTVMRAENQRLLDSISERNFERIMQELDPEKQKALRDLQERERVFERTR